VVSLVVDSDSIVVDSSYRGAVMDIKRVLVCFIGTVTVGALIAGCGTASSGGGGITTFTPTWIAATWSGGAAGPPNDRTDVEAEEWDGRICPASSATLINYGEEFAGLNIINSCTLTVTYGMCVSKGSLPQPSGGLNECATDPFDTPFADLKFHTITNGTVGDFVNTTEILSLNIFYCSDEQSLCGPPICDSIQCL